MDLKILYIIDETVASCLTAAVERSKDDKSQPNVRYNVGQVTEKKCRYSTMIIHHQVMLKFAAELSTVNDTTCAHSHAQGQRSKCQRVKTAR